MDQSTRFAAFAIPISVVVDCCGNIRFQEEGALPDIGSFIHRFDAFIGNDYTESIILDNRLFPIPNVAPSTEEDLGTALNVKGDSLVFSNGMDAYD